MLVCIHSIVLLIVRRVVKLGLAISTLLEEIYLMARIKEITQDGGDPVLAPQFASEREYFGDLLNPTKVMAHCPPILAAAKNLYASIDESGLLPVTLLSLVYARVAALNGCPF